MIARSVAGSHHTLREYRQHPEPAEPSYALAQVAHVAEQQSNGLYEGPDPEDHGRDDSDDKREVPHSGLPREEQLVHRRPHQRVRYVEVQGHLQRCARGHLVAREEVVITGAKNERSHRREVLSEPGRRMVVVVPPFVRRCTRAGARREGRARACSGAHAH